MKSLRYLLAVVLIAIPGAVLAQSAAVKSAAESDAVRTPAPADESQAQKTFDELKALQGTWEGTVDGAPVHVTLRVTSMGNALLHEMNVTGRPDDPITMIHVDGDRLLMTHYCDAGNQPRFVGTLSPDGKTVDFAFLDVTNYSEKQFGHMQHVVFTLGDANHHSEEWTFMVAGGKPPMGARMDLQRTR